MFLNHLYGGMDEPELKIIDVFVCKLRKKLAQATEGDNYIETVWGRGYVLRDPAGRRDAAAEGAGRKLTRACGTRLSASQRKPAAGVPAAGFLCVYGSGGQCWATAQQLHFSPPRPWPSERARGGLTT